MRAAQAAGVKAAAVQDKVYLPGFHKLRKVRDSGFFGRILSARLEAGWWVFDGELHPTQRSSWNYRKKDGGGLVLDMYPHWRYLLTEPDRPDQGGVVPQGDADPAAHRRGGRAITTSTSRTRCSRRSNSRAARSRR